MAHSFDSIERRTQELLRQAGALSVPVDVRKIASTLEAKIHESQLEDDVSGVLIVKGAERHVLVNSAHHPARQRFSIGHELGHLVLHDQGKDRLIIDKHIRVYQRVGEPSAAAYKAPDSTTTPAEEREANAFAAALLMPAPFVELAVMEQEVGDELDIAALARSFAVSEQAMSIRLQQLRLVEPVLELRSAG